MSMTQDTQTPQQPQWEWEEDDDGIFRRTHEWVRGEPMDYEYMTAEMANAQAEALAIAEEALGKLRDRSSMPWPEYGAKYGLDMSHTHHTSRWPTTFEITDSALSRIAEKKAGA